MSIVLLLPLMATKLKIEAHFAFLSLHFTWYGEPSESADAVLTEKIREGFQLQSDDTSSMQKPSQMFGELLLILLQEKKKKWIFRWQWLNVSRSIFCCPRCVAGRAPGCEGMRVCSVCVADAQKDLAAEETLPINTQKDTGVLLLR